MEDENVRSRGKVVRFDDQKGYGFIKPDEGGEDLFVHHSSIKSDGFRSLQQGESVEFSVALEGDHTKAVDVSSLGGGVFPPPRRTSRFSGNFAGHFSGGPSGRGGGSFSRGVECYNCGMTGHIARECRVGGGERVERGGGEGCYNCGMTGHIARECRGGGGGERVEREGGEGCYNCGMKGHIARECRQRVERGGERVERGGGGEGCYNCGGFGHIARECPSGRAGGRFGGGGGCYSCGEAGHFARECTNKA